MSSKSSFTVARAVSKVESNFHFTQWPIFGVKYFAWELNDLPFPISELPLQLGPGSATFLLETKSHKELEKAKTRQIRFQIYT